MVHARSGTRGCQSLCVYTHRVHSHRTCVLLFRCVVALGLLNESHDCVGCVCGWLATVSVDKDVSIVGVQ